MANAVHVNITEGRAYLRLEDGRGWVSERLRNDFAKLAVISDHHQNMLSFMTGVEEDKNEAQAWEIELRDNRYAKDTNAKIMEFISLADRFTSDLADLIQKPMPGRTLTDISVQAECARGTLTVKFGELKENVGSLLGRRSAHQHGAKRKAFDATPPAIATPSAVATPLRRHRVKAPQMPSPSLWRAGCLKVQGNASLDTAANEKAKLELGRDHFAGLKDGTVTGSKAKRQIANLVALGKQFSFDDTLLMGFPGAIGAKLEKRTACDDMFLTGFSAELDSRIAVHETTILAGEPDREARAAA